MAEGVHDSAGRYWAEMLGGASQDASGQRVFSMSPGAGAYLVQQVQDQLGLRCRQIKLNTAQRSTRLLDGALDRQLAALVGTAAVEAWAQGLGGVLPILRRQGDEWRTELLGLEEVAGRERTLPPAYRDDAKFDITEACRRYIAPLIGDPPPAPLLWIE